jgi:adenosylcobinamide kinase / adenosylcobinamide-phosphate guanylyltransferase
VLTVLLGGARSGKSSFAEQLAARNDGAVTYLATCPRIEGDVELDARIDQHRADRPAHWSTIEEEHDVAGAISALGDETLIVDCLTTWVSNLMHVGHDDETVLRATDEAIAAVARRAGQTIVTSNEVGLGIVPREPSVRRYRDLLGRVNQRWVVAADRPLLLVAGRALALHRPEELL